MKRNKQIVRELRLEKKINKRQEERLEELLEKVREMKERARQEEAKDIIISADGLVMARSSWYQDEDSRYIRR